MVFKRALSLSSEHHGAQLISRPHGVPEPPPCPPPKHLQVSAHQVTKREADSAAGCMRKEYIDAIVVKVDDVDVEEVQTIDDLDFIETMQGIYWLNAYHDDKPMYKQQPSESDALLLWWQIGPKGGWYITDMLFDNKKDEQATAIVKGNNYKQFSGA